MLKKLKQVAVWIAIVFALLIAWKVFDDYRFMKSHQRAMDLLGVPLDAIDRAFK